MGSINFTDINISEKTKSIFNDALVWDDHACMPLRPNDEKFLPQLDRVHKSGCDVVSLNVGFDAMPWDNAILTISTYRRWLKQQPNKYILVNTVKDIERACNENKLAVMFDLEGGIALNDHLPMIQLYYDLGVRWMLFAYNFNNSLSGGCMDNDKGLTEFGRSVVREMENVGMGICCSHIGHKSSMEIMEMAEKPIIFSHSNPKAIWNHVRSIRDEAIIACAKTGGVIAIAGIGDLLGENDARIETYIRHLDYVVQLVGPDHVGLGLDYVYDKNELTELLKNNPELFPPRKNTWDFAMIEPEQIPEIADKLLCMGYSEQDIRKILGENHLRVARQVWK